MSSYLETIDSPQDLKALPIGALGELAQEMREALIYSIMKNGGHLGSNLAVIEMTIALHYVFNSPEDKFIFDVSHQSYAHKMLTGRKMGYMHPDDYAMPCGFTNPEESVHDFFELGHTSSSISIATGIAKAFALDKKGNKVIAIIGDGSLSGGQAFEGLNNASRAGSNMIIVVNDNEMSIAPNQGGLYQNLKALRESHGTCELNIFKAMGLDYIYVEDGHDIPSLIAAFKQAATLGSGCVVHVHTIKGKGHPWALSHKEAAHKVGKAGACPEAPAKGSFEELTCEYLQKRLEDDPKLLIVSAATPRANGLFPQFRKIAGDRFIDVGIAEEHAVSYIAGAAKAGAHPVLLIYSTFLQRAYDQIMQDLALNNCPATILVFRSGIEGGPATHSGVHDISMVSHIPNLKCLSAATRQEYLSQLAWSLDQNEGPTILRVPRTVIEDDGVVDSSWGGQVKYRTWQKGSKVAILALGSTLKMACQAAQIVERTQGICPTIVDPRTYSDIDADYLTKLEADHSLVVVIENGIVSGGFGQSIAEYYGTCEMRVVCIGEKKKFFDYTGRDAEAKEANLTAEAIAEKIIEAL